MAHKVGKMHKKIQQNSTLAWNMLDNCYKNQMLGVVRVQGELGNILQDVVNDTEKFSRIKDPDGLVVGVTRLKDDLEQFVDRLEKIHTVHKTKKGPVKSEGDVLVILQSQAAYADSGQYYCDVLLPATNAVLYQAGGYDNEQNKQEVIDVTPISDKEDNRLTHNELEIEMPVNKEGE